MNLSQVYREFNHVMSWISDGRYVVQLPCSNSIQFGLCSLLQQVMPKNLIWVVELVLLFIIKSGPGNNLVFAFQFLVFITRLYYIEMTKLYLRLFLKPLKSHPLWAAIAWIETAQCWTYADVECKHWGKKHLFLNH